MLELSFRTGKRKKKRYCVFSFFSFDVILYNIVSFNDLRQFNLQFHFDQSKVRSEIRLREGRARPIDVLTKHLNGSDDLDIEINEPYMVFKVNLVFFFSFYFSSLF